MCLKHRNLLNENDFHFVRKGPRLVDVVVVSMWDRAPQSTKSPGLLIWSAAPRIWSSAMNSNLFSRFFWSASLSRMSSCCRNYLSTDKVYVIHRPLRSFELIHMWPWDGSGRVEFVIFINHWRGQKWWKYEQQNWTLNERASTGGDGCLGYLQKMAAFTYVYLCTLPTDDSSRFFPAQIITKCSIWGRLIGPPCGN